VKKKKNPIYTIRWPKVAPKTLPANYSRRRIDLSYNLGEGLAGLAAE
jgi:hypothetical protein